VEKEKEKNEDEGKKMARGYSLKRQKLGGKKYRTVEGDQTMRANWVLG